MTKLKFVFVAVEPYLVDIWKPVLEQVLKMGHEGVITDDHTTEGDIGLYCDDKSLPGNQKFTVISINGLDQDHVCRPRYEEYFLAENWNCFDLGVLPGPRWQRGFENAIKSHRCSPRLGALTVGWPKCDHIFNDEFNLERINNKEFVVLYAPQTEQDGKQKLVVDALKDSGYKLVIKHWETEEYKRFYPWLLTKEYFNNLRLENRYAEESLNNVTVVEPSSNFIDIVPYVDLLVTDQSSVLYEASLYDIPTLTVEGWKHACGNCMGPQPSPDIVLSCRPEELRQSIDSVFDNYARYQHKSRIVRDDNYVNLGVSSSVLVASLVDFYRDEYLEGGEFVKNPYSGCEFYPYIESDGFLSRTKVNPFSYNDGDAAENYIYESILNSTDLSVGSSELISKIRDWPSYYHFTDLRVNLFRPFLDKIKNKDILELGSGCGALTRYLAENARSLFCVEGSQRRAKITAARCRGLDNVRIYNDNFQTLTLNKKFDVVTMIGVLEYSQIFIGGKDPIKSAIINAKRFLKPDGVLIVAIENKLGLKYFAGAYEDHIGIPFYGVEGLYGKNEAITFGRKELDTILSDAGFSNNKFYYPYPDYKVPSVLLSSTVFSMYKDLACNLLSGIYAENQAAQYNRMISEGAAQQELIVNGLAEDFANSFLIFSQNTESTSIDEEEDALFLAAHYSNNRKKEFCKETSFYLEPGIDKAVVRRKFLYKTEQRSWISFDEEEALEVGELLFNSHLKIVNKHNWNTLEIAAWVSPMAVALCRFEISPGVLPGSYYDATPFNFLINTNAESVFIDLEWCPFETVPTWVVLFRGLYNSLLRVGYINRPSSKTTTNVFSLCAEIVNLLLPGDYDFMEFARLESKFFDLVSGHKGNPNDYLNVELNSFKSTPPSNVRTEEQGLVGDDLGSRWFAHRVLTDYQYSIVLRSGLSENKRLAVFVTHSSNSLSDLKKTIGSLLANPFFIGSIYVVTEKAIGFGFLPTNSAVKNLVCSQAEFLKVKLFKMLSVDEFDYLTFMESGTEFLEPGLLSLYLAEPADLLYFDEAYNGEKQAVSPVLRPSVNLDYLLSFPAGMTRHWLFSRNALLDIGGFDASLLDAFELDAILRLINKKGLGCITHIPEPLVITEPPELVNVDDERKAIEKHLIERGYTNAKLHASLPGRYRVLYGHESKPLVSILIPTKNQLNMIQRCVESILEKTNYQNYEILIIDNNSDDMEAVKWLDMMAQVGGSKVRVLRYPYTFNFSAMNNFAAGQSKGDYLLFLNNDTAVIDGDWLDAMVNHGQRSEVGAVGAKLVFPNGTIQHAGVILGLNGPADHPFIGVPMDTPGYMQRLQVDQNYSAVTAACLLVYKEVYFAVGGMDEENFKVSYNDVDLCLKIREQGYLNVWTPHAVLLHEGSVSQKNEDTAEERAKRKRFAAEQDAMYEKWLPQLARDPAYNPNFSLAMPGGFKLADSQISWRPLDSIRPAPVALVHPADLMGCGHYRVMQPFLAMKNEGLLDGAISTGLMHVTDLERYNPDCIVLQRQIGDVRLEAMQRMQKFSRAFKIYELDDYLPNLPLKSVHRKDMPKDILRSLRRGLSFVDRFVVSTHALAEAFSGLHGEIVVRENRLPLSWWGGLQTERRQGKKPRVGWAGGSSHTGDLELIADVVRDLADEVEWVFFGMCPEALKPYVHEFHGGVPIEQYPAKLASLNLDLGLAPLEHNLFNECKSNLRQLEYGVCGIPIICTDIRPYQDGLQAGLPVTLVKNRYKDWVDAIRMHINDLDATAKMADELQAKVHAEWMLQGKHLEEWRDAWLGK